MFDILEADIVVMQETKIQRKDLRDDMVLVPGWDVYFSLPKHKKGNLALCLSIPNRKHTNSILGYSGVAIYTRSSVCAPIRAEEGITGILTPPNSTTSYCHLPENQRIGGYPSVSQLSECELDAATLDSEGRCVILEFPAFVLIGVYSPANRDESRDEFRIGFLNALDARVRNLVAAGKRVFLTGDLNIIRDEIDTANAAEQLKKHGMTIDEYVSTPARRMLNHLVFGGKVLGERDEGRETSVMWDLCRLFHPDRRGMFTCWEQKINARPGNYGSRIDYVLCSYNWNDWFFSSDIQEGLLGSDHCPVYAVLKQKVQIDEKEVDIKDIMSAGMFKDGVRQREWTAKDLLPLSAKLIPEFDRRRSIKDMFAKKPALNTAPSLPISDEIDGSFPSVNPPTSNTQSADIATELKESPQTLKRERGATTSVAPALKRNKTSMSTKTSAATAKSKAGKGQSSLMGFFKTKDTQTNKQVVTSVSSGNDLGSTRIENHTRIDNDAPNTPIRAQPMAEAVSSSLQNNENSAASNKPFILADQKDVIDPIVAKESWSKILGKRVVPRCDHNEPCMSKKTTKPGENCGRSFYMCSRPLGPSGQKEKNTQWRCGTFIWSSDWAGDNT